MNEKPILNTKQIWNLNFGFLGLQVAFSLVMANTSRLFSAIGADTSLLSIFWIAPPLAGLIIQPIIGYWSDRVWTPFGRRIPFMVVGAVMAFVLLFLMPSLSVKDNSSTIWNELFLLFLLQVAFNLMLLSFRSLVGDQLNSKQQNKGFSVQTFICNVGGIIGALLPFILATLGLRNLPIDNEKLAPTLSWSFYIGAFLLLLTILWSVFTTKEYPPHLYQTEETKVSETETAEPKENGILKLFMQIGIIQFFSWIAFFYLWVYATDAIANKIWNTNDPLSEAYNNAGNWFGVLTSVYSIVAILFSARMAQLSDRWGVRVVYGGSLIVSAIGFFSMYFIDNQYLLILSMLCIGMGWASILTFPFSIIASKTTSHKMGLQMGLINVTITLPQIAGALSGLFVFKSLANEDSLTMMICAGCCLLVSAFFAFLLKGSTAK